MTRLLAGDQFGESTIADMRSPVVVRSGDDAAAESLFYRHGGTIGLSSEEAGRWRVGGGQVAGYGERAGAGKRSP